MIELLFFACFVLTYVFISTYTIKMTVSFLSFICSCEQNLQRDMHTDCDFLALVRNAFATFESQHWRGCVARLPLWQHIRTSNEEGQSYNAIYSWYVPKDCAEDFRMFIFPDELYITHETYKHVHIDFLMDHEVHSSDIFYPISNKPCSLLQNSQRQECGFSAFNKKVVKK